MAIIFQTTFSNANFTEFWSQGSVCQWMSIIFVSYNGLVIHHLCIAQIWVARLQWVNILKMRQNGCHYTDNSFKCIFLNENVCISIKISLKLVPKGPINNITALVQIMASRRPGDKPLSEPMMTRIATHICITQPQWVKYIHQIWSSIEGLSLNVGTLLNKETAYTCVK